MVLVTKQQYGPFAVTRQTGKEDGSCGDNTFTLEGSDIHVYQRKWSL
jgi:hypothetical protein